MMRPKEASIEFLNFIADISHSGTGEILIVRLSDWLDMTPQELNKCWQSSRSVEWATYANDVLSVLDAMQDKTESLALTLAWYRRLPISLDRCETAEKLVQVGCVGEAVKIVKCSGAETVATWSERLKSECLTRYRNRTSSAARFSCNGQAQSGWLP